MKQFGNPPLSKRSLLSTNPLFLSNYFMTPLFVKISKTRPPLPPNLVLGGEETLFPFLKFVKSISNKLTHQFGVRKY